MIQQLKSIMDEDRGVSPVIGVILMVAITVILAAVIGTLVLGLGDSLQQAPQSQLNAEVTGSTDSESLEISHNGGDSINADDLRVTIADANNDFTNDSGFTLDDGEFNVGDTITIDEGTTASGSADAFGNDLGGDKQVRVIHEPSESIILDTEVTFDDSTS